MPRLHGLSHRTKCTVNNCRHGVLEGKTRTPASSFAWQAALHSLLPSFVEKLQPGQKVLLFGACHLPFRPQNMKTLSVTEVVLCPDLVT